MPKDIFEIEPQIPEPPVPTERQQRAIDTNGWDTIANRIDAVAGVLAVPSVPHMNTWLGITFAGIAYGADPFDGWFARRFGVDSETLLQFGVKNKIGEKVDAVGDKIKLGYGIYHIWKNDQAPKTLLAAVAIQNLANAAIIGADNTLKREGEPKIVTSREGKLSTLMQTGGIGINVIGTKVAENRPTLGRAIRISGTAISLLGLVKYGYPATKGYLKEFKEGIEPLDRKTMRQAELKRANSQRV